MRRTDKVVWGEGMFLTPHLFQQEARYNEARLQLGLSWLGSFGWGLTELEIDREALTNGTFTVVRCRGLMPDGLPVQIPDGDEPPGSRALKGVFAPTADRLDAYLAIPVTHPDAVDVRIADGAGGRPLRYRMELARVPDETAEGNEREVPVARKMFKTLFAGESLDDTSSVKIAELVRTPAGAFALDEAYVPPSLTVSASARLMMIQRRLLELLAAKSNGLSGQRRHVSDFGVSDVANFWLLHTVNSAIPILAHFATASDRHPEQLYTVLVRLAGELTTFALQTDVRDLPRYAHDKLGETFGELESKIMFLLETVIPTRYVMIPLERTPELLHVGRVQDDRLFKTAQFYLGANAQVSGNRLIDEIPAKAKISAPDQINDLIGRAVSGVTLTHEPVPPGAIPVKTGFKYFHLGAQGRGWDAIARARGLAIYLPDEFPDVKLELVAVKE